MIVKMVCRKYFQLCLSYFDNRDKPRQQQTFKTEYVCVPTPIPVEPGSLY